MLSGSLGSARLAALSRLSRPGRRLARLFRLLRRSASSAALEGGTQRTKNTSRSSRSNSRIRIRSHLFYILIKEKNKRIIYTFAYSKYAREWAFSKRKVKKICY